MKCADKAHAEIQTTGRKKEWKRFVLRRRRARRQFAPYCTATIYGGMIFMSGMIGVNPQTGKAPEGGTLAQAEQAFENIKTVLAELGADTGDVLKTTVFLTNIADFSEVNKLYAEVFGPDYPARTCVEVSALPMGLSIEVECIAKA